jgi:hypothetical protein
MALITVIIPELALGETAVYNAGFTAPRCTSGVSPCNVPSSLINSRDNMAGASEPNQPNTLVTSSCSDGNFGTYNTNESLNSFIITDPSPPYYRPTDSVNIQADVYCDPFNWFSDYLYVYTSPSTSSPSWSYRGNVSCPGMGSQTLNLSINLPAATGNIVVRLIFQRGAGGAACNPGAYNDHDDVVLWVSPDSDGDGLLDVLENSMCTNPALADTDGDGLCDGPSSVGGICVSGEDIDADGVVDPSETDPCNSDTDADGMDDRHESTYGCLAATTADGNADPDGDMLTNLDEYLYSPDLNPCSDDTDGEGLSDEEEIYDTLTDPTNPDTDGDGLPDDEGGVYSTDPNNPDTDGDGMPDGWEVFQGATCGLAPLVGDSQGDGDADGMPNLVEYQSNTDPCLADTDGDGLTDGFEYGHAGSDFPCVPAGDCEVKSGCSLASYNGHNYLFCGDTVSWFDARSFCQSMGGNITTIGDSGEDAWVYSQVTGQYTWIGFRYNTGESVWYWAAGSPVTYENWLSGQPDLSGYCVVYPMGSEWNDVSCSFHDGFVCEDNFSLNPRSFDSDWDGLTDFDEVNVHGSNPTARDTDWDGMDDGWENTNAGCGIDLLADDGLLDADSDGLDNIGEYNTGTDPCAPDTDGDGLSDGDEINIHGSDPTLADTDGDGMEDGWEAANSGCGVNILVGDSLLDPDGDGLNNIDEYNRGTNPCDQDTDGDGVDDGTEVGNGSNPLDEDSFPSWAKSGLSRRITYNGSSSNNPSLTWAGSEFGVSWHDQRDGNYDIYFSRISAGGSEIGDDIRLTTNASLSEYSSLVWTGSEFGVSWHDERDLNNEIYFTRVSAGGTKKGSDIRLTTDADESLRSSLTWTGSEFGVSWNDERGGNIGIYFTRVTAGGTEIGDDIMLTTNGLMYQGPSLAWTGSEFGVSWPDDRGNPDAIYFTRVSVGGTEIGDDIEIDSFTGNLANPSLSWTGSEFGLCWEFNASMGGGPVGVDFTRISSGGTEIGFEIEYPDVASPSLTWTGSEFGVTWVYPRDGDDEIYFSRISANGTLLGDDIWLTENASGTVYYYPSLAWSGSAFGVSWQDERDGNYEIYFALIDSDMDGDGLASYDETTNYMTDPYDWDTDNDGMNDGFEVNGSTCGLDPLAGDSLADHDGDSLANFAEYNLDTDPCNPDTDGDGMYDGWENSYSSCGLDLLAGDSVLDADTDGLNNIGEYNNSTDPCDPDTDGEGLSDGDEVNIHGTDPTDTDTDGDGLDDAYEVNTSLSNPLAPDTDGDGLSDGDEVLTYGTDPNQDDTDTDGLSDWLEIMIFSNPTDLDADGDGLSDGEPCARRRLRSRRRRPGQLGRVRVIHRPLHSNRHRQRRHAGRLGRFIRLR